MTRKTRVRVQPPAIEVVSVRTLPGDRRVPKALVTVRIGPVAIVCGYARLRRQRWEVMYPKAADGGEGVTLPPDMEAELVEKVKAAAEADPDARKLLLHRWW